MRITLCGSVRFESAWLEWNRKLTLAGHIVYSVCAIGARDYTEIEKNKLDVVHMGKIDNSDAILVLDVGGYVGESTRREIFYAQMREKGVYYLSEGDGEWLVGDDMQRLRTKEELNEAQDRYNRRFASGDVGLGSLLSGDSDVERVHWHDPRAAVRGLPDDLRSMESNVGGTDSE